MAVSPESRVPPGQRLVTDFPVLHAGSIMHVDAKAWTLTLSGLVSPKVVLDYDDLLNLPVTEQVSDIHCVTGWSKLDTRWKGVPVTRLLEQVEAHWKSDHGLPERTSLAGPLRANP